jgi:hypothetical protein|tara:strand:- start:13 stop:135 length:123 start_codon:yes stop_codon:yes gene_type:complete
MNLKKKKSREILMNVDGVKNKTQKQTERFITNAGLDNGTR